MAVELLPTKLTRNERRELLESHMAGHDNTQLMASVAERLLRWNPC